MEKEIALHHLDKLLAQIPHDGPKGDWAETRDNLLDLRNKITGLSVAPKTKPHDEDGTETVHV